MTIHASAAAERHSLLSFFIDDGPREPMPRRRLARLWAIPPYAWGLPTPNVAPDPKLIGRVSRDALRRLRQANDPRYWRPWCTRCRRWVTLKDGGITAHVRRCWENHLADAPFDAERFPRAHRHGPVALCDQWCGTAPGFPVRTVVRGYIELVPRRYLERRWVPLDEEAANEARRQRENERYRARRGPTPTELVTPRFCDAAPLRAAV